jgi:hypothetical protein
MTSTVLVGRSKEVFSCPSDGYPKFDRGVKSPFDRPRRAVGAPRTQPNIARQSMSRSWSKVLGAVLFFVGAIGMAIWLWFKRRQLALAAAKAIPGQASAAATEEASAVANAIPDQASSAANAVPKPQPSKQ